MNKQFFVWFFAAVSLFTLAFSGCSKPAPFRTVQGELMFNDIRVANTELILIRTDKSGEPLKTTTSPGGAFYLSNHAERGFLPGEYQLVLTPNPDLPTIPKKYFDAATSDLKFEVKSGMKPLQLQLTP